MNKQTATLAGGCFWCTEAIFQRLRGVVSVIPGYAGGRVKNPSYEQVSSGDSGHAEVVQVEFDADVLSYADLLDIFWQSHDPTSVDRQGSDVGSQYRSIIFYHDDQQKKAAELSKNQLNESGKYEQPIVTQIKPLTNFYQAENYHHHYFNNNRDQTYCKLVIDPKLKKLSRYVM